jgi:hypothetical protein
MGCLLDSTLPLCHFFLGPLFVRWRSGPGADDFSIAMFAGSVSRERRRDERCALR